MYNPYSTLRYLETQEAESYWYSSGTPSFLIDLVRKSPQSVLPLRGKPVSRSTLLDISRIDRIHLAALMFQTGYLTVRGYNRKARTYTLDFPNKEVREAFFNSLLQEFMEVDPEEIGEVAEEVRKDLEDRDITSFIDKINTHFAKVPYHLFKGAQEGFYHAIFFTLLEKSEIKTATEIATNRGRIDLICETPHVTCIFELKLDQTADVAFTQAEAQKYKKRHLFAGKEVLVIGINFDSKSRDIGDWRGAVYSPSGECIREISPKEEE